MDDSCPAQFLWDFPTVNQTLGLSKCLSTNKPARHSQRRVQSWWHGGAKGCPLAWPRLSPMKKWQSQSQQVIGNWVILTETHCKGSMHGLKSQITGNTTNDSPSNVSLDSFLGILIKITELEVSSFWSPADLSLNFKHRVNLSGSPSPLHQ